jgi:hypothetical protein
MELNITDIRRIVWHWERLLKLSRSINRIDSKECSDIDLTNRDRLRRSADLCEARQRAEILGVKIVHQSDPRGVSLYLVENDYDHKKCPNYNTAGLPVI